MSDSVESAELPWYFSRRSTAAALPDDSVGTKVPSVRVSAGDHDG